MGRTTKNSIEMYVYQVYIHRQPIDSLVTTVFFCVCVLFRCFFFPCDSYARKAKKVDVRRLKGDLWRKIDAVCFRAAADGLSLIHI